MFFGEEFAGKNPSVLKTHKLPKLRGPDGAPLGRAPKKDIVISVNLKDWLEDRKAKGIMDQRSKGPKIEEQSEEVIQPRVKNPQSFIMNQPNQSIFANKITGVLNDIDHKMDGFPQQ